MTLFSKAIPDSKWWQWKLICIFYWGFTRTTSSELIRWYDEICPRRLVSSIRETLTEPFRAKEISFTHSQTQIYRDIPDFHGIVKKKSLRCTCNSSRFLYMEKRKEKFIFKTYSSHFSKQCLRGCFFFFTFDQNTVICTKFCIFHSASYQMRIGLTSIQC